MLSNYCSRWRQWNNPAFVTCLPAEACFISLSGGVDNFCQRDYKLKKKKDGIIINTVVIEYGWKSSEGNGESLNIYLLVH